MDSAKEIIRQEQQRQKTYLTFSGDSVFFPCPHGTMVRKVKDGRLKLSDCEECCKEHEEKKRKEDAILKKQNRYHIVMSDNDLNFAIPRRFASKSFSNYRADNDKQKSILGICKKFSDNFENVKEKGTSLIFCGKPGTGKTHLAYAIMSELRDKRDTAVMVTAADMTSHVKNAYKGENDRTPMSVVSMFSKFDLLIVDEVGVQVDSDSEKRIFFDIINKRYENMLPTILISNLEKKELSGFIGERVMDRMSENGGVVFAFDWSSHR